MSRDCTGFRTDPIPDGEGLFRTRFSDTTSMEGCLLHGGYEPSRDFRVYRCGRWQLRTGPNLLLPLRQLVPGHKPSARVQLLERHQPVDVVGGIHVVGRRHKLDVMAVFIRGPVTHGCAEHLQTDVTFSHSSWKFPSCSGCTRPRLSKPPRSWIPIMSFPPWSCR